METISWISAGKNERALGDTNTSLLVRGSDAGGGGYSLAAPATLPDGFTPLSGYKDKAADNFGNIQFRDGSQMIVLANMPYRIGHVDNATYADHGVNSIETKYLDEFPFTAGESLSGVTAAGIAGYAIHRMFHVGGEILAYYAVDKYINSKNAMGAGFVASSVKNGAPISSVATHNPMSDLTACTANAYYECVNAPHARDGVDGAINPASIFHCETRFITAWLHITQIAHGQAAASSANCAWYDATGVKNVPASCDNDALGSADHGDVSYTTDGFLNCCLAGSGVPYAKTTHNGQACGVEVGGTMWRVTLGLTRGSENDNFYVLKKSVDPKDLTSGENGALDAWGNNAHLATIYDVLDAPHITHAASWTRVGNGANQALSGALSGAGYELTGLGLPMDANAKSGSGTNLFGQDGIYEFHKANLCFLSGGFWLSGSYAGAGAGAMDSNRSSAANNMGFRSACALRV